MKTKPITNLIINKSLRTTLDGSDARCFIDKDKIFKLYKRTKPINSITDFSSYKSDSIAFPLYYLDDFIKDFIAGEVMNYFNKQRLYQSLHNGQTNIDKLVANYGKLRHDIKKFPEIYMNDLFSGNILYDETGFTLVDTTKWNVDEKKDYAYANISVVANEIMEIIVEDYMELNGFILEKIKPNFLKYGEMGADLYNLLSMTSYNGDSLLEILDLYRELVFRVLGVKIETLDDIYNNQGVFKRLNKG